MMTVCFHVDSTRGTAIVYNNIIKAQSVGKSMVKVTQEVDAFYLKILRIYLLLKFTHEGIL